MEIVHPDGGAEFTYTIGIKCSGDEQKTIDEAIEVLRDAPTGRWEISLVPFSDQYLPAQPIVFFEKKIEKIDGYPDYSVAVNARRKLRARLDLPKGIGATAAHEVDH